jgi:hypothetical protein
VKRNPAPAAADAARDMLSAGAVASSGTAAAPRAVLEPDVGVSPDDVSERDRLNLAINYFSPSQVAAAPDMMRLAACSTSACRGGDHDLASTPIPTAAAPASFASVAHVAVLEVLAPQSS